MCNPYTTTPAGYDVNALRTKLDAWLKKDKTLSYQHVFQWNTADCFDRANGVIPQKWQLLVTTWKPPQPTGLELVNKARTELSKQSFKPKVMASKPAQRWLRGKYGYQVQDSIGSF